MTHVVIPLYAGVTPLDFAGPYQLLRALPEMDIELAAIDRKEVAADGLTFGAIPDAGRVVRDGNRITGGGVTAGIDFALSLIAELRGEEAAQGAQLLLEYAPEPPFDAGLPETAPRPVMDAVNARLSNVLADAERRITAVAERLRNEA